MTAEGGTTLTARPNSRSRHRRRRERTVRADDRRWQERASRWRTPASRQPRSARDQFRSPPHPASGQACAPVGSVTARRMMHQVCAARDTRGDLRDQCVPRPRPGWCPRICLHVPEHDTACPRRFIKPARRERCNMKAGVPINGTTAEFSPNFAKGPIEAFVHRPASPALIFCTDLLH